MTTPMMVHPCRRNWTRWSREGLWSLWGYQGYAIGRAAYYRHTALTFTAPGQAIAMAISDSALTN